jgi:glucose/arabinose dehydrogenase
LLSTAHGTEQCLQVTGLLQPRLVETNPLNMKSFFAEGWLVGALVYGRPVDVLVMHDGALLVSDDRASVIYRISYRNK